MPISFSRFGSVIRKTAINEYNIIRDSKRAAEIAKGRYPGKVMAGTRVMMRKLAKDVGPEPAAGFLLGLDNAFGAPGAGDGIETFLVGS